MNLALPFTAALALLAERFFPDFRHTTRVLAAAVTGIICITPTDLNVTEKVQLSSAILVAGGLVMHGLELVESLVARGVDHEEVRFDEARDRPILVEKRLQEGDVLPLRLPVDGVVVVR